MFHHVILGHMTQKIKFQVVYATGSDEDYSSSALENHGPTVKGWRSERFCVFPQELVLQFPSPIRVRKLQLLSHQFLIARKVELFIGNCRQGTDPNYRSATFSRLGYISFDTNEKSSFKARELKSVHLDCEGLFIKLSCQKNHVNKHNVFNQVGLVAVNLLGDFISSGGPDSLKDLDIMNNSSNAAMLGNINKPEHVSMIDDITFGMYQDPEVGRVIKELERKKHMAIEEERYEYAKRLKQAVSDLYKVGERLGRLEKEKKAAVSEENYDLAQAKKVQANEIRMVVFEQLNIKNLLQSDRLKTDDSPNVLVRSPPHQLPKLNVQQETPRHYMPPEPEISSIPQYPELDMRDTKMSNSRASDRPIPTLANKGPQPTLEDDDDSESQTARDAGGPDEQSMKMARDLTSAVDMFTHETVACLFCKQFALRERGINEISVVLDTLDTSSPTYSSRAIIQVFKQAFTDPVYSTFSSTLSVFKTLVRRAILSKSHSAEVCSNTLPVLLKRLGENVRLRDSIIPFFKDINRTTHLVHTAVIPNITANVCKEKNPKLLTGRLLLLDSMLENVGISEDTYSVDLVMKFVSPFLSNTSRDVRDLAIRITLFMYRKGGDSVRKHLPKDDPILRKKQLIWKKIYESFDEIDGKPVKNSSEPSNEEKKAAQVAALKAELAELREMAANANLEDPDSKTTSPKAKKGAKPVPRKNSLPPAALAEVEDSLDKTCMFCNEQNDEFNPETLDVHFWKACPMLSRCEHCSQVVEIAGITSHLLSECSAQNNFSECKNCELSVEMESSHRCPRALAGQDEILCPLCRVSVRDGEDGWREHLMGKMGCSQNPRRGGTK